jgi:CrcB protein
MLNAINTFSLYAFVALGGASGACLRFFISQVVLNWLGKGFPFATLIVNIIGSLLMGALYGFLEHGTLELTVHRTLIGIGFLGALTTFSTFSLDTLLLFQQGDFFKAILNVVLNITLCILAAALGMYLITHKYYAP